MPIGVGSPPMLARIFGVRNRAVMATTSAFPTLVICRCLEAFFDFSPRYVEDCMWNYVVYYSSIIEYVFDTRTESPAVARTSDVGRVRCRRESRGRLAPPIVGGGLFLSTVRCR